MTAAIVISLIALTLTVLGLVYKISSFATEQRISNETQTKKLEKFEKSMSAVVTRVPYIELRVSVIEKRLGLSMPEMHELHGEAEE